MNKKKDPITEVMDRLERYGACKAPALSKRATKLAKVAGGYLALCYQTYDVALNNLLAANAAIATTEGESDGSD